MATPADAPALGAADPCVCMAVACCSCPLPRPRPRPRPLPRGRPRGRPRALPRPPAASACPCPSVFDFFGGGPLGGVGPITGATGGGIGPISGATGAGMGPIASGSTPARSLRFSCCFNAFLAAFSAFCLRSSSSSSASVFTSIPAAIFRSLSLAFFFCLFSMAPARLAAHEHASSKMYSYFVPSFWHCFQRSKAFCPMCSRAGVVP